MCVVRRGLVRTGEHEFTIRGFLFIAGGSGITPMLQARLRMFGG